MKPAFLVTHDSTDITGKIADRLLLLRTTDEAGVTSDQFELALDNRDGAIAIPETGAVLQVALGYEGQPLYDMGRYTIDEIESSGMPRTLSLRGKAADMKASLKNQKKRDWEKTTLGKIVETIAGEHGMQAKVAEKYRDITVDHLDQTYESDMNILTRLAEQYGAVMKPAGGFLLFVERGVGVNADGQPRLEFIYKFFHLFFRLAGGSPDYRPVHPVINQVLDLGHGPQSPAGLYRDFNGGGNFNNNACMHRPAGECSVKVNDMEVFCAFLFPLQGYFYRVSVVHCFLGQLSPAKPDTFSVPEINCGNNHEIGH